MSEMVATIEAKSRAGTGILVKGKWYNGRRSLLSEINKGDKVKMDVDGQDIVSLKPVSAAPESRSGGSTAPVASRYDPAKEDRRQRVILHQAARRDAIDTAFKMVEIGATKLPAKQSDQFDAVMALINVLTRKYEDDANVVYDPNYDPDVVDESTSESGEDE